MTPTDLNLTPSGARRLRPQGRPGFTLTGCCKKCHVDPLPVDEDELCQDCAGEEPGTPRRRPNHSLLNWSNCRQYALDVAKETRPASNFDRVSQEQVHPHLEAIVRKAIERLVHTQPSGVRTIKIESHKRRPV